MTSTISSLQAELEELEKRIKALSTSQSTLTQLVAIRDYFDKVQEYLILLNDNFDSHTQDCQKYSTQIENLASQIAEINVKIENIGNSNTDEINSSISELEEKLNADIQNLTDLTLNSGSTMASLDQDILALQTDLAYAQDNIDELNADLSSTNTQVGDMQTTINNLNSTQNTLTTAQSSLSSKVSGIDTRLTTAENNISALTGGIDVSALDSRIIELERTSGDSYTFKDYFYGFTPTNYILHSKFISFSAKKGSAVKEICTVNYTSSGSGTLTIELYKNYEVVQTYTVDLTTHPTEYTFSYKHFASTYSQSTKIVMTATNEISYNSMCLEIFGTDIEFYNCDRDLKVACYNGKIYVTRYQDGLIKYGLFESTDDLDLDNLPYSTPFYNEKTDGIHNCQFVPRVNINSSALLDEPHDVLAFEGIDGKQHLLTVTKADNFSKYESSIASKISPGEYVSECYNGIRAFGIKDDKPFFHSIDVNGNGYTVAVPNNTYWKYCIGPKYNHFAVGNKYFIYTQTKTVAQDIDGYFYYFNWQNLATYIYKIGKGKDATAFAITNNDVNIYITDGKKVDKYRINDLTSGTCTSEYITTIEDCDCIYQTFNNQIIKHTVSTDTWSIDTLEY